MTKQEQQFLSLLRFSIDTEREDDLQALRQLSPEEWEIMFHLSVKHALAGVCFRGVQKLPKDIQLPYQVHFDWLDYSTQVVQTNKKLFLKCVKLSDNLRRAGWNNCVLKGQGNALMYPDPYMRNPGDIDIWLDGTKSGIVSFVKMSNPQAKVDYHHVEFQSRDHVDIEVHTTPSYLSEPLADCRLQRYFRKERKRQCGNMVQAPDGMGTFPAPTKDFNLVFQLTHLYRHVFHEGIGLRQMLDYYFLLKQGINQEEREKSLGLIKSIHAMRFAQAVMSLLQSVFNMPDDMLLVKPNRKEGDYLLEEILIGGVFGISDNRFGKTSQSAVMHNASKSIRISRYLTHYPMETIFEPYFRIKNFFVRKFFLERIKGTK